MHKELTEEQLRWLIANYSNTKNADICIFLCISMSYLHRLARMYNCKKSANFMSQMQSAATAAAKVAVLSENVAKRQQRREIAIKNSYKGRFKKGEYVCGNKTEEEQKEINAKRVASWKKTRELDIMRLNWGLPQRTNFRPPRDSNPDRQRYIIKLRSYMRRIGYIINEYGGMVVEITSTTKRSDYIEKMAKKLGFIIR